MRNLILEDDTALIIQPKLIDIFGLTESILLQQIHYWLQKSENIIDGVPWIYNSYNQWHSQIKFLSKGTIIRVIKKLEKMKVIKSANFNKMKMDRTKWYTIDYEMIDSYVEKHLSESENACDKSDDNNCQNREQQVTSIDTTIPKTTTEITPKEEEEGFGQVVKFYEKNLNMPSSHEIQRLLCLAKDFNYRLIVFAMEQAIERNARNLRYIEVMLYSWRDNGLRTKEQVISYLEDYKKYKEGVNKNGFRGRHYEEGLCNNSKDQREIKEKWKGIKAKEPMLSGNIEEEEGII